MPTISNLSFNVRFNLTGAPALVLTDTTTSPPGGFAGIFTITQPDGYTRTGDINTPDINAGGGSFSYNLTLDSTGNVQKGTYVIKYTAVASGYISTDFTRNFVFDYDPPALTLLENFDVFTPSLSYIDSTNYQRGGYNASAITRSWTAVSAPTGTITGNTTPFSLIYGGQYYDANYTITLASTVLYTHQVYTYLTVQETVTKTIATYAQTPMSLAQIVTGITSLKTQLDATINSGNEYGKIKDDFEYAHVLFNHIMDRLRVANTYNIFADLKELIIVLSNYQIPTYTPTNAPIPAYNLGSYNTVAWGGILGNIQNQTDLWNILQNLYLRDTYVHNQSSPSTTWSITHNMGKKPSVSIVDTADDQVEGEVTYVSNNQLIVKFSAAVSGKAYLN